MTPPPSQPGRLQSWLRLLRVPNLLTVPGDPIAGFMLGAPGCVRDRNTTALIVVPIVSLLVYAAGLIHNDLCDVKEDRRDRPGRPLACGAISIRTAWAVFTILILAAVGLTWAFLRTTTQWRLEDGGYFEYDNTAWVMRILTALILCVVLYNRWLKRNRWLGAVAMGACRGLSLAFGGMVVFGQLSQAWPVVLILMGSATVIWGSYVAAVTVLAADESIARPRTVSRFLPLIMPLGLLVLYTRNDGWSNPGAGVVLLVAVVFAARPIWALPGISQPRDVQKQVGWLIRNLLLLQAAVVLWATHQNSLLWIPLLACWPVNALLARKFYAS